MFSRTSGHVIRYVLGSHAGEERPEVCAQYLREPGHNLQLLFTVHCKVITMLSTVKLASAQ